MKLYGALILLVTLSAACGLKCYTCSIVDPDCTKSVTCPQDLNRCSSVKFGNIVTKTCSISAACISPINCCDRDLCNGAAPTGPRILLLLASSALLTLFI